MYKYLQEDKGQSQLSQLCSMRALLVQPCSLATSATFTAAEVAFAIIAVADTARSSATSTAEKVKCQRACKFCRKSHTTCGDTRPCQRCIKRDIAQLCLQDEADQLAQQAQQQAQQQHLAAGSNGSRSSIPTKRRQSSFDGPDGPDRRPSVSMGGHFMDTSGAGPSSQAMKTTPSPTGAPGTELMGTAPLPNMMQSPTDTFRPQQIGFEQDMQPSPMTQGRMGWYDPAFQQAMDKIDQQVQPQQPQQGAPDNFTWSQLVEGMLDPLQQQTSPANQADFAWFNPDTPNGRTPSLVAQAAAANASNASGTSAGPPSVKSGGMAASSPQGRPPDSTLSPINVSLDGPVNPFNYTFGYSRLKTFASQLPDQSIRNRISTATERFKSILHGCLSQYSDDQIVSAEVQFLTYVRHWSTFCDTIPVPACIWRRTGEIAAMNRRMAQLLELPPGATKGKALYNVLDPVSFTEYWEDYGNQVLHHLADRSNIDTVVPIAFAQHSSDKTHLLSSSMLFDTIGLPLVATGVFTPLHPPGPSGGQSVGVVTQQPQPQPPASEPTIDVQVGGTPLNPVIRPIPLTSLAYMWMV